MSQVNNHQTIKIIQLLSEQWVVADGDNKGEHRFILYGVGENGKVYKKIGSRGRGWIELNMELEFIDDGIGDE